MNLADVLLETLRLNRRIHDERLIAAWRDVDTDGLTDLLAFEGGELWLYRRWQRIGVRRHSLRDPSCWDTIEFLARATGAQNLMVRAHGEIAIARLHQESIPCVFIKGVARQYMTGIFPYVDARATNDVDLLVPREHQRRAWDILMAAGYKPLLGKTPEGHYHLPPLLDPDGVPVELHSSTTSNLEAEVAWRRLNWSPPNVAKHDSRHKAATELIWHGLTHAFTHGIAGFRMRFFLDAASVLAVQHRIDWSVIRSRLESKEEIHHLGRAMAWLEVAAWLAGSELPEDLHPSEEDRYPLRRTTVWRLHVFSRLTRDSAWRRKLLSEATLLELRLPSTPGVPGTAWPIKLRRRGAALLARTAYRHWRRTAQGASSTQLGFESGPEVGEFEGKPQFTQSVGRDSLTGE